MMKKASKKSARGTKTAKRARLKKCATRRAVAKKRAVLRAAPKRKASAAKRPVKKPLARKTAPAKTKKRAPAKKMASAKAVPTPPPRPRRPPIAPKDLRRRPDDADAFLRVRSDGRDGTRSKDDFAEELGEDFVGSATSGEEQTLEARDAVVDEESGGPFVTTPAKREFAEGLDASNPEDAEREPFPSVQSQSET